MNKREIMLNLLESGRPQSYFPAAFFLHFDPIYHQGQAAIEKHLEFFRYTGMDFIKIQYEHSFPKRSDILKPIDWKKLPLLKKEYFDTPIEIARGLVKSAKKEALVLVTLYSPLMCAGQVTGQELLNRHLQEDPEAVKLGIETATESLMNFVRGCINAGVDGFYASTQGAESSRFSDPTIFLNYIKPYDLEIMHEINQKCIFNILHICDYHGTYRDLSIFIDYPGHIVNCGLKLSDRVISSQEVYQLFKRPYMGGMDRHGVIATGDQIQIRQEVLSILKDAPEKFILAADCTVPGNTPWDNLKTAIETAHQFRR